MGRPGTNLLLNEVPRGLDQFLLREQIIGEVRGSKWIYQKVNQLIETIAEELENKDTPDNGNERID